MTDVDYQPPTHKMASDLSAIPAVQANVGAKGLELTPYDEQRQVHPLIDDDTEVVVSPRSLAAELCCPICLDLLTNTMTTKECLHRFCHDCIQTAMMKGNKECPTCRKRLVSRRSLRPDPNFDAIIQRIFPSREEYNKAQSRAMERFNRQCSTEALQQSIKEGMAAQAKNRKLRVVGSYDYEKRVRRKRPADATAAAVDDKGGAQEATPSEPGAAVDSSSDAASTTRTDASAQHWANEVELVLRPSNTIVADAALPPAAKITRFLKTTQHATILHLSEYLRQRITQDATDDLKRQQQQTPDEQKPQPDEPKPKTEVNGDTPPTAAPSDETNDGDTKPDVGTPTKATTGAAEDKTSVGDIGYSIHVFVNDRQHVMPLSADTSLQTVRGKYFANKTPPVTLAFDRRPVSAKDVKLAK